MRLLIALALCAAACSGPEEPAAPPAENAAEATAPPRLEKLWTAEGFAAPEGPAAAPQGGWFISNVAGGGMDKDGEGWISLLSETGEVTVERFADGLDAPKGLMVHEGLLYAADIDILRIFDAATGAPTGEIAIDGAMMLNDVTVWDGAVFVSDTRAGKVYRIEDGSAKLWLDGPELEAVNGVFGDGDRLLIATMASGSLYAAGADGALTLIADGLGKADGIGLAPGGGWIVSDWPGEIYYISPDGEKTSLLNTREEGVSQNDVSVFGDIVIAPNWTPGTVTAWRLVR